MIRNLVQNYQSGDPVERSRGTGLDFWPVQNQIHNSSADSIRRSSDSTTCSWRRSNEVTPWRRHTWWTFIKGKHPSIATHSDPSMVDLPLFRLKFPRVSVQRRAENHSPASVNHGLKSHLETGAKTIYSGLNTKAPFSFGAIIPRLPSIPLPTLIPFFCWNAQGQWDIFRVLLHREKVWYTSRGLVALQ